MKIGLVRRGFSGTGGAERYLQRFAEAATLAGHECVLFAPEEWRTEWNFGELCVLKGKGPKGFSDALERLDPRARCDVLFSLERVAKFDCYRAGDGVHRAWLERRARYEPAWKPWIRKWNENHREILALESQMFAKDGAGTVIANSNLVRDEIIQFFDFPSDRIKVVYNGIPKLRIASGMRESIRRQLNLSDDDYVVLFVGSGWERKGLRFAIRGVLEAHASKPVLLIAGEGNASGFPTSERIKFMGAINDLTPYYAASDIFLLPTLYDPFSNACLEALAAGLPVITTQSNGFSEIIAPGVEGEILSEPADITGIAKAIEKWSDPERLLKIKPRLEVLGTQFDITSNLAATISILETCENH